jgi:hypothetical protein
VVGALASYRHPPSRSTSTAAKTNELIVAVGWKAFIHEPMVPGTTRGIPATDGGEKTVANDLSDGEEVEITAWQPRSREGITYRVERLRDGAECWIRSIYLRRERLRPAAPAVRAEARA